MVNNLTLATKLKALRKSKGYTQQEVADLCELSRATVAGYETGRRQPHLPELQKMAKLYGVGLDYFDYATKDEVFEIIARATAVFESDKISKEEKDELHKSLMSLYLKMSEQAK